MSPLGLTKSEADLHKVFDKHTLRINEMSIFKWYTLTRKMTLSYALSLSEFAIQTILR